MKSTCLPFGDILEGLTGKLIGTQVPKPAFKFSSCGTLAIPRFAKNDSMGYGRRRSKETAPAQWRRGGDWNDERGPRQGHLTVRRSPSSAMSSGDRNGTLACDRGGRGLHGAAAVERLAASRALARHESRRQRGLSTRPTPSRRARLEETRRRDAVRRQEMPTGGQRSSSYSERSVRRTVAEVIEASALRARRLAGAGCNAPIHGGRPASRESSTDDSGTSGTVGHGRVRLRKRHGVPMRTPALRTCAPARRRKLLRAKALRLAVPGGRGRREREGGAGSDPAVRGTAAGSGPCAFAHPRPLPLGSLPAERSLRGKAVRAPLRGGGPPVRRLTGRGAVRHRRARPGRARPGSPFGLPARDCWTGSDPRRGWDGRAHPNRRRAV